MKKLLVATETEALRVQAQLSLVRELLEDGSSRLLRNNGTHIRNLHVFVTQKTSMRISTTGNISDLTMRDQTKLGEMG
jgi:hypothetical protein